MDDLLPSESQLLGPLPDLSEILDIVGADFEFSSDKPNCTAEEPEDLIILEVPHGQEHGTFKLVSDNYLAAFNTSIASLRTQLAVADARVTPLQSATAAVYCFAVFKPGNDVTSKQLFVAHLAESGDSEGQVTLNGYGTLLSLYAHEIAVEPVECATENSGTVCMPSAGNTDGLFLAATRPEESTAADRAVLAGAQLLPDDSACTLPTFTDTVQVEAPVELPLAQILQLGVESVRSLSRQTLETALLTAIRHHQNCQTGSSEEVGCSGVPEKRGEPRPLLDGVLTDDGPAPETGCRGTRSSQAVTLDGAGRRRNAWTSSQRPGARRLHRSRAFQPKTRAQEHLMNATNAGNDTTALQTMREKLPTRNMAILQAVLEDAEHRNALEHLITQECPGPKKLAQHTMQFLVERETLQRVAWPTKQAAVRSNSVKFPQTVYDWFVDFGRRYYRMLKLTDQEFTQHFSYYRCNGRRDRRKKTSKTTGTAIDEDAIAVSHITEAA